MIHIRVPWKFRAVAATVILATCVFGQADHKSALDSAVDGAEAEFELNQYVPPRPPQLTLTQLKAIETGYIKRFGLSEPQAIGLKKAGSKYDNDLDKYWTFLKIYEDKKSARNDPAGPAKSKKKN
jgi:hypothetical protein